jgi:hypothetical protein
MSQTLKLLHPRFGFADAFNLNIADSAIPGCIAQGETRFFRTSGPWANFNGFGIDHGPMAVIIDNFLHQNFVPKLFMSYQPVRTALTRLFPPAIQFSTASFSAGEGVGHVDITVTRANNMSGSATVQYATNNGTASAGADYIAAAGTLGFADGETSKTFTVFLIDDASVEGDETINVALTDQQSGMTLGSPKAAVITIVDNDTSSPTPTPTPTPIQLLTEESASTGNQVAVLDAGLFVRDPFSVGDVLSPFLGLHKRVMIFVSNLPLVQGDTSSAVVVNLIDNNNKTYDILAEDVRAVPNFPFVQIVFRLPDSLPVGTCTVRVTVHGQMSNLGTFRIRI